MRMVYPKRPQWRLSKDNDGIGEAGIPRNQEPDPHSTNIEAQYSCSARSAACALYLIAICTAASSEA